MKKNKRLVAVLLIIICILSLSQCISNSDEQGDIRGREYAGSAACKKCHQNIYDNFIHTAHFNTSHKDVNGEVQTAFTQGKNEFEFNDSIKVVMTKVHEQYYQTEYVNGQQTLSHSFDIVIGSGRKAQTFFYYDTSNFFQLPISYFVSEHTWANSPGFPSDGPKFNRIIPSGCFACHSSFVASTQSYTGLQKNEKVEKDKIIYGVDCERCHGPAASHIAYHNTHPDDKQAKFIANISGLDRNLKVDMCSLCHSGVREPQQSLFTFRPGNKLSDFYFPDLRVINPEIVDVHGKQSQLMLLSKCYQASTTLTCNSCHNVHVKERENIQVFSQRCITCHSGVHHTFEAGMKNASLVQSNCIDCHMPLKASKKIALLTKQRTVATPDFIRTHLITVYPEETKRFLDSVSHISN